MPTIYGLFAAAGCVTAVAWLKRHRQGLDVSDNEFWAAMWTLLLGGVVGAKALFVVLGWEHYARGELGLWADFRVGFVFFGGFAGALAAGALFAALRGKSFVRGADYFAVAIPLGHAIGRIGCFFAGCCHGRPPHPVQLYEALGLGLIAWTCRHALPRIEAGSLDRGAAFRLYLALYGALRLVLDPLRADGRPERFLGLSHQQGLALAAIAAAVLWQWVARPPRLRSSRVTPAWMPEAARAFPQWRIAKGKGGTFPFPLRTEARPERGLFGRQARRFLSLVARGTAVADPLRRTEPRSRRWKEPSAAPGP